MRRQDNSTVEWIVTALRVREGWARPKRRTEAVITHRFKYEIVSETRRTLSANVSP